jgi:hypothetical protein
VVSLFGFYTIPEEGKSFCLNILPGTSQNHTKNSRPKQNTPLLFEKALAAFTQLHIGPK